MYSHGYPNVEHMGHISKTCIPGIWEVVNDFGGHLPNSILSLLYHAAVLSIYMNWDAAVKAPPLAVQLCSSQQDAVLLIAVSYVFL